MPLPCQSLHSFLLLGPVSSFILKPQEVGRGLGQASAWRKSWEEVAFDLKKDGRGLVTHAQGPEVLCHQGYMGVTTCLQ